MRLGLGFARQRRDVVPGWVNPDALLAMQFGPDRYWRSGAGLLPATSVLATTRSSGINLPNTAGEYQSIGVNELPRTNRGLYANGQAQNLLLWSQEFDRSIWLKTSTGSGTTPVVTPDAAIAPDGSMTADLIEMHLNGGTTSNDRSWLYQNRATATGVSYNSSFFVKAASPEEVGKVLRMTGADNIGIITLTADWQRVTVQETESSGQTRSFGVQLRENTAQSARFFLWQGQVTITDFTVPPILTTSAAETLMASDIRAVQGVRPSNSQPEPFPGWEAAGLDDGFSVLMDLNCANIAPGGTRSPMGLYTANNSRFIRMEIVSGSTWRVRSSPTEGATNVNMPGGIAGGRIRAAVRFADGVLSATQTGAASVASASAIAPAPFTRLYVGNNATLAAPWNDWIYELQICSPLSDDQLLAWVNA